MNKNPFVPSPGYPVPQPPLPPGPPPAQPAQVDYSAWWAAAQQPHAQQAAAPQYGPQWTAPQPPRPPHEQSALYANYGYGNAPGQWQRQQQQQQQHQPYQPGQPYQAAPAAPQAQAQPAYNPYQPAAGYPQQYVAQPTVAAPPQPMAQPAFQAQQPQQQFFNPHMAPTGPQQPRMHQPPTKRQRFDGPNANRPPNVGQHPLPPQPQFQTPIAPSASGGPFSAPAGNRNGPPSGPSQMVNAGRGGGQAGRGGLQGGRGRGGSFPNARGGLAARGRGGSFTGPSNVNRGGGPGIQPGGPLRGHGSRNNFGGGARRGNASFNASGGFQRGGPFRNAGAPNRPGNRHDGQPPTGPSFVNKDAGANSSFMNAGKKDENRRTLTDFKIVGLSIPELDWSWGVIPQPKLQVKEEAIETDVPVVVKEETVDGKSTSQLDNAGCEKADTQSETKPDISGQSADPADTESPPTSKVKPPADAPEQNTTSRCTSDTNATNPPPSRMRIYFHTPVTADDSRPIPHSVSPSYEANRKGKRKKLEDDDGDMEEGRAPPPPPQMSGLNDDRASVAASVATDAVSEDWLMAAIVEGEDDAKAREGENISEGAVHNAGGMRDEALDDLDAEGEVEALVDGDRLGDDVDMGGGAPVPDAAQPALGTHSQVPAPPEPFVAAQSLDGLPTRGASSEGQCADAKASFVPAASLVGEAEQPPSSEPSSAPAVVDDSTETSEALFDGPISPENAATAAFDDSGSTNAQAQVATTNGTTKSLEDVSAESTVPLIETQEGTQVEEATQMDDGVQVESSFIEGASNHLDNGDAPAEEQNYLPEPPLSPSSNVHDESVTQSPAQAKHFDTPSANRLSISYAAGNRRLVVNAESVLSFKLFRHDGRVEVSINLAKNEENGLKGVLVEGLSDTKSYIPLSGILDSSIEADETVPPFSKLSLPTAVQLVVHLDTVRPLSEPKWAKSGDVQEWLKSMFGRMFWVAGDAAEGWEKKIQVVDPDPPPTIWTFLDGWASNSPVGSMTERHRFVKTHMSEIDNVLEILLRLVRGERATPSGHNQPQISVPSLSGALLTALTPGSAHAAQQTHVSLAVLAIFRQTVEYAKKALGDEKGKAEAEEKVGDIIRCLPSHLIYKSLDGIFKEWKMEKKRG